MSKELHEWAFNVLSGMNASKYEKRLSEELPAAPADCAKALRYISAKHKWKTRISVRGRWVTILVISKAKPYQSVKQRGVTQRVEAVMKEMKPGEVRRFEYERDELGGARAAVYRIGNKMGVRFGVSKSKGGPLLIIRRG